MPLFRAEVRQGSRVIATWSASKEPIEVVFYQGDFPIAQMTLQAPSVHDDDDFTLPLPDDMHDLPDSKSVSIRCEPEKLKIPEERRRSGDDFTLPFPEDSQRVGRLRLQDSQPPVSLPAMEIWRYRAQRWSRSGSLSSSEVIRLFSALISINVDGGLTISGPTKAHVERLLENGDRVQLNTTRATIHLPQGDGLLLQTKEETVIIRPPLHSP